MWGRRGQGEITVEHIVVLSALISAGLLLLQQACR